MAEPAIRAVIKTAIEGVSSVGNVYDRLRYSDDFTTYLSQFKVSGTSLVKGWTITCEAVQASGFVSTGARNTGNKLQYQYRIRGYYGFEDSSATETTAFALALSVQAALNAANLQGATATTIIVGLASITTFEPRAFGGTLCHYTEIEQNVTESI